MTSRETLEQWFNRGVERKATHMIVVCDTFSYDDYPVYVLDAGQLENAKSQYDGVNMQRIMETYDLSKPFNQ